MSMKQTAARAGTLALALALALALSVSAALAHETWLLPDDPHPAAPGELSWSLASGMKFGEDGSGIATDRIVTARLHAQAGDPAPLEVTRAVDDVTVLSATAAAAGTYCAEIVLRPRALTLDPASIDVYFEEIGAPVAMREAWAASENPELWRETYTKFAKGLVRVGAAPSAMEDASGCWAAPLGHALEFVPEQDPTLLSAGDRITLRVLVGGAPAPGQAVRIVHQDEEHEEHEHEHPPLQRADENGHVQFMLDEPGRYMVYATKLVRSSQEGEDWTSDFATLVFAVEGD